MVAEWKELFREAATAVACGLNFKAPLIRVWVMEGQVANAGKDMLGASEW